MATLTRFVSRLAPPLLALLGLVWGSPAWAETNPSGNDKPTAAPADWLLEQQGRNKALSAYLTQKSVAYLWFKDFPFGASSGAPFIVLQLPPRLAPEEWGGSDNFLDVVGLFKDERNSTWPIAQGYGWTALSREDPAGAVDYAALTSGPRSCAWREWRSGTASWR